MKSGLFLLILLFGSCNYHIVNKNEEVAIHQETLDINSKSGLIQKSQKELDSVTIGNQMERFYPILLGQKQGKPWWPL